MSTSVSTIETIFSRTTFLDGNSMTSIADSEEPSKIGYLVPPDPLFHSYQARHSIAHIADRR
jgi:hypothetical protein